MNAHILLIHPLYGEETEQRIFQPGVEFPISLVCLSAVLEQNGIDNDVLDLRLESDPTSALHEMIDSKKPLAVGITASTAGIENAARLASQVKAMDSNIVTIIGGWHASALPEETLRKHPEFDYLIHGEGEIALVNLLTCIMEGNSPEGCKGLAFRSNGTVRVNEREKLIANLDELPFPARHKVSVARYHPKPGTRNYRRLPSTGLLVGRGCPYNCLFCYKGVWGRGIRFRSPDNVLEEIELCVDRFGIRDFRFYDDTVTFPRWDLKGLCEGIINKGFRISWNCWSRVNDVDEDKLRLMKAAGCYHIKFGIEFGTEKALKLARKGATLEQARGAVALAKKVGLECKGSFIFGIPGETIADCRKTADFALEISPHFATFYAFDPIPGSPFYEQIAKGKVAGDSGMLPREKTQRLADEAYRAFYLRPTFIFQRIEEFMVHPIREGSMLLSGMFMLVSFWLKRSAKGLLSLFRMMREVLRGWALRIMSVAIAIAAVILTSPVWILLVLIIKVDSPGPAIFKQTRVGKNRRGNGQNSSGNGTNGPNDLRKDDLGGKPFTFYKFRTMYVDAKERFPELYRYEYTEDEIKNLFFKFPEDPRLTRFGRRLRKTTLDEIPNFFNVVRGDMNLVGPRPDIPEMIKYYEDWQRIKFSVKPGITGLAQINGRGLLNFRETLYRDVEYVKKRSLWLDLRIVLKTFKSAFLKIGAF